MKVLKGFVITLILIATLLGVLKGNSADAQNPAPAIGERPALEQHVSQADIEAGSIKFKTLLEIGETIFATMVE